MHTGGQHREANEGVDQVRVRVSDIHRHDLRQTGLRHHTSACEQVEGILYPDFVTQHTPPEPAHHVRQR